MAPEIIQPAPQVQRSKFDEEILVVKRDALLAHNPWHGLKTDHFTKYLHIAHEKREFIPRGQAEEDPTYKQIIPYLVFTHAGKYFLMQRQAKASETRLQSKWSLGIGGHIRQEDITGLHIFDWARREFHEEVSYNGSLTVEPLGVLNDDTNDVGKVHIGFVLLLKGDSSAISIKSELKSGHLATLEECALLETQLETWSQIVLTHLQKDS